MSDAGRFFEAVKSGDISRVRAMLASRPTLIDVEAPGDGEHRAIHYSVLRRDVPMTRLLMEAGANARIGIFPHRDATAALTLARERGYDDVVQVIEEEERHRREEMSCPNATVSPVQDRITALILQGESAEAMRMLDADRSLIQACDRDGATVLHVAAQKHDLELIAWLLDRRAPVRKHDLHGFTALDRAALAADPRNRNAQRFPALASLLLEHGADLTVRAAVALGDEGRVRQFIRDEPDLLRQIANDGGLLALAVKHGRLQMVQLLLDLGADVNERILLEQLEEPAESWGMPLWYAALAGHLPITKLLLDRGADPNANVYASGWPLRNAWNHPDGSVKNLLLARGARRQPYMVAEMHDIAEARKLLSNGPSEEVASELAWSAADHGCPEIVEIAIKHLEWPPGDSRWNWVIVQPIRGAGDNGSSIDGHLESLAVLLKHGVDPNVSRFGECALHYVAARHGGLSGSARARFASLLLDFGAKLNVRDELLQSTPLAWACRWGRQELVELLLRRGARVDEPDAEFWATPIAWAAKMGHQAISELLQANHSN